MKGYIDSMSEIKRTEINEEWAHSGIVEAGGFAAGLLTFLPFNDM
jgi:hypothetical protein